MEDKLAPLRARIARTRRWTLTLLLALSLLTLFYLVGAQRLPLAGQPLVAGEGALAVLLYRRMPDAQGDSRYAYSLWDEGARRWQPPRQGQGLLQAAARVGDELVVALGDGVSFIKLTGAVGEYASWLPAPVGWRVLGLASGPAEVGRVPPLNDGVLWALGPGEDGLVAAQIGARVWGTAVALDLPPDRLPADQALSTLECLAGPQGIYVVWRPRKGDGLLTALFDGRAWQGPWESGPAAEAYTLLSPVEGQAPGLLTEIDGNWRVWKLDADGRWAQPRDLRADIAARGGIERIEAWRTAEGQTIVWQRGLGLEAAQFGAGALSAPLPLAGLDDDQRRLIRSQYWHVGFLAVLVVLAGLVLLFLRLRLLDAQRLPARAAAPLRPLVPAHLLRRALAAGVDLLLVFGVVLWWPWLDRERLVSVDPLTAQLYYVLVHTVWIGYASFMEGWKGKTLGKYLLGIAVVSLDGGPVGWSKAFLRGLLRPIDGFPNLPVGLISMLFSPRAQRLGDRVAGTVVVRDPPRAPSAPSDGWWA